MKEFFKDTKKRNLTLTIIISLILVIISSTLAYFNWESTDNPMVDVTVSEFADIIFKGGNDISVTNMGPVLDYNDGEIIEFSIKKRVKENRNIAIKLKPTILSENLKHESFKCKLLTSTDNKNFQQTLEMDFTDKTTNKSYQLLKINITNNDIKYYKIIFYIDGNMYNPDTMKEQAFEATIQIVEVADSSNANEPILADGMIPVMHNGTTWVKADLNNQGDNYWYDYGNKMWANATMVKTISEINTTLSDGTLCTGTDGYCTREDYMTSRNGVTIPEEDILAYYVWIPRYEYMIFNEEFAQTEETEIQVAFLNGTSSNTNDPYLVRCSTSEIGVETCTNKANGNWYTHPAFTFGDKELEGIWVGKFETTYGTNTTGYPDNTVYTTPTIKPNVTALRKQQVSKQFQTAQYFGTTAYLTSTGVNEVDAHMMKNIEWGAVAYLKQSVYGLGTVDIAINNSGKFLTGKSSGDPTVTSSSYSGANSYSYDENKIVIVEGSGTNVSHNITNDTTYPWIQLSDGTYKSQTQGVANSETNLTVTFTLTDSGLISFDYSVSTTEYNDTYDSISDYLYYTITNSSGTVIDDTGTSTQILGTSNGTSDDEMTYFTKTHYLEAGSYTLVFTYKKDGSDSNNYGTDAGYVKNINVLENVEIVSDDLVPAGQLASTTGNITGVYDMSGGAIEYVMGVINGPHDYRNPIVGTHQRFTGGACIGPCPPYTYNNSGFSGVSFNTTNESYSTVSGMAFPDTKYYDLYAYSITSTAQTPYNGSHLGDAIGETRSWYGDNENFVKKLSSWFARGGMFSSGTASGVFGCNTSTGNSRLWDSFRVVLSPMS